MKFNILIYLYIYNCKLWTIAPSMSKSFTFHTIISLLFLFFLNGTVIAQSRLESGTVFFENGDSLQVSIDIIKTENNFKYCYFRIEGSKEEQALLAEDITGFMLDIGRRFISKTIKLEGEIITVIAEYLVDGINSLLVFRNSTEEYFILITPRKPDMIITHELQDAQLETGEDVKIKSNRYIGLLKYQMDDTPLLHPRINSMTLSQKNLVNLSREYHDLVCTTGEKCIVYKKSGIHSLSMLAPYMSVDFTMLKFSPEKDLDTITLPFSVGYSSGGILNVPLYRGGSFVDLQFNLFYSNRRAAGEHITIYRDSKRINNLEYQYSAIGLALDTRFLFKPKELAYTFSVGPTVRLALNQKMDNAVEFVDHYDQTVFADFNYIIHKKTAIGGVKTSAGILIPVTVGSMLHLSLDYYLQYGKIYINRILTVFYGNYAVKEQVIAIRSSLYF